jgi:predicted anti-sigma-YlaC factor YlaD
MNQRPCEQLDEYLAGGLQHESAKAFTNHLRECDDCRKAIDDWQEMVGLLRDATLQLELPPEDLVRKINSEYHVRPEPRRKPLAARMVAAAVAACLVAGIALVAFKWGATEDVEQETVKTVAQEQPPAQPEVQVQLPDDVIGLPIDIDDANVTVVWIYPTEQLAGSGE